MTVSTIEYIFAVALFACAIILVLASSFATRKALKEHTNQLKSQTELINSAKRRVQADMHSKASDQFEKSIEENAGFIKKDLKKTGDQMSAYVRTEFDGALTNQLKHYEASAEDIAKVSQAALTNLQTAIASEQTRLTEVLQLQHAQLATQLEELVAAEKARRIAHFEGDMASIVESYIKQTLVDQIDIDSQLEYIVNELERNKAAIAEDLRRGI